MSKSLAEKLVGLFGGLLTLSFGKELIIFIISLLPILELRGGLIAASLLDMNPIRSYIICFVATLIPVPFILLFMNKFLAWMRKSNVGFLTSFAKWLDNKVNKNKDGINRLGYIGLALFVGIPLPGTGVWTGSLIASGLEMDKKKAFIAIFFGNLMASIIMMLVSFGIIGNLIH